MLAPRGRSRLNELRQLARHNARMNSRDIDDLWPPFAPSIRRPSGLFEELPVPSRFENLGDYSLPYTRARSPSPDDPPFFNPNRALAYPRHNYNPVHDYRNSTSSSVVPFDRAATDLKNCLDAAIKFCRDVETEFRHETASIGSWVDPHSIDALWGMKMAWNGLPAEDNNDEYARHRGPRAPATVITFDKIVRSLQDAVDDFRASQNDHANVLKEVHRHEERLMVLLRKLQAELKGVEDLCEAVRRSRRNVGGLRRELADARDLVAEIRGFWRAAEERYRGRGRGGY